MSDGEIRCEGLVKVYNQGQVNEFTALKGLDFTISEGDFMGIMGPSGSGKSTLLNLISCLDTPTKGEVYIEGTAISTLNGSERAKLRREKLGFVFQQFNLIRTMTSFENIELPMRFKGTPAGERRRRIEELLSIVGLEGKGGNKPTELSGGEQQRVAIARALANNPKIIMADEPTGNLDTKTGTRIIDLLVRLNKEENKTLVMVTHDPGIAKTTHRVIRIQDGKILP
ncbi:MAG: ABC transporter ATP-binding protein [Candidatus Altiarchaeota archaeon]|nr:ABC transporter ATP-binding protein [Candidatus Altiarchaeota archaeon]